MIDKCIYWWCVYIGNYQAEKAENIYGVFWWHFYDNTYFLRNTPLKVILAENYLTNNHNFSHCKQLQAALIVAETLQQNNYFSLATTGGSYITRLPVQPWYTLATKREVVRLLEFASQLFVVPVLIPVVTSHAMS